MAFGMSQSFSQSLANNPETQAYDRVRKMFCRRVLVYYSF